MANDERQGPIERVIGSLGELESVLGPDSTTAVGKVRELLTDALAERDRGDREDAVLSVARAMAELANLGDRIGGMEGQMMRALTGELIKGFAGDDRDAVERNLRAIESQAGTPKKPGNFS